MSPDLLALAHNYFIGSTLRQLSPAVGASEPQVQAALPQVLALALGTLLARAAQPGGPAEVFGRVYRLNRRDPLGNLPALLHDLNDPASPPHLLDGGLPVPGPGLLRAGLGPHYEAAVAHISQQTGAPAAAVPRLLQLALAVGLRLLGRHATQHQLDARGLAAYLLDQHSAVVAALHSLPGNLLQYLPSLASPAASRPAPTPGDAKLAAAAKPAPAAVASPAPAAARPTPSAPLGGADATRPPVVRPVARPATAVPTGPAATGPRRWPWLLVLLAVVLATTQLYLLRRPEKTAPPTPPAARKPAAPSIRPNSAATARPPAVPSRPAAYLPGRTVLALAGGAKLRVSNNSAEARLYHFLQNPALLVSRDQTQGWLLLDQVYFEPGTATLTRESLVQLANLAAILQAFPHAALKLGGYADDQAGATKNLLLSADCANAARKELLRRRVAPGRVAAEGYGQAPTRPASSASPTHGRRVYVRIMRKY